MTQSIDSGRRRIVIVGASGTVGRGIARQMAAAGWLVTAVGRNADSLAALGQNIPTLTPIVGSVANDVDAAALAASLTASGGPFDAIVTAVNMPLAPMALLDCSAENLLEVLQGNLVTHLCAARALLPLLASGGRYIGIGGGMADFTFPGMGPVSICQAAQRNMFRFLAMEGEARGVSVAELMLYSQIVDPADEETAGPRDIRSDEVGAHVRAVLEQPEEFAGPILALKSRKQVGQPQRD